MNDWIGCLETTPQALTPNIDRLAARGVNFTNAHTAGVFCAPSRAAIFSGQLASTTGCYTSATYWIENPDIEPLQVSFAKGGYKTLGTGKLFHHPAGAIDKRGWDQFHLRTKAQRESGWPLDSWKHDAPYPDPFPASIFNRGQTVTGADLRGPQGYERWSGPRGAAGAWADRKARALALWQVARRRRTL